MIMFDWEEEVDPTELVDWVAKDYDIHINDFIALCHIGDDISVFNKNFVKMLSSIKYRNVFMEKLGRVSKNPQNLNKYFFGYRRVKKFYLHNKKVIDLINYYSDIQEFVKRNFYANTYKNDNIAFFEKYIIRHKKHNKDILFMLNKIKDLGINRLVYCDSDSFFDNVNYEMYTSFDKNIELSYLDNMYISPNYNEDKIKYYSAYSNYKIVAYLNDSTITDAVIYVDGLDFSTSRLPEVLNKETMFDKLVEQYNNKRESKNRDILRNTIDLDVCIEDLSIKSMIAVDVINKLENISNKEDILSVLSSVRDNIVKLEELNTNHKSGVFEIIPQETLKREKALYLVKRDSYNDIC